MHSSPSVLLNVSCHKKHEYVWFMGGYLNEFRDSKLFSKLKGWGMTKHAHGDVPISVIECVFFIRNNIIFG